MFLQTVHVLSDFQVGNFSINLCRSNVAVSEHLAERFHCYTIGKADGRGESMASHVKGQAFLNLAYLTNIERQQGIFRLYKHWSDMPN